MGGICVKRSIASVVGTTWLAWSAMAAVTVEPDNSMFQGADIFRIECATDPQIRPDGRLLVYARKRFDIATDRARLSLWMVDVDSGTQTPLVTGPASYSSPRWSPDGTRLAYLAVDEQGRAQLMVRWMQSGTAAQVVDLVDAPKDLTWSPDGRAIAFVLFTPIPKPTLGAAPTKPDGANWAEPLELITDINYREDGEGYLKPGNAHLFVVASDGGAARQLTTGPYDERGPIAWTPDGRYVLVSGNRRKGWQLDPINSEVFQVSVADGAVTALTNRVGPDDAPAVSPDGRTVAYLGFDDHLRSYENVRLYLMDRDGRNPRSLTDNLDRSVDQVRWAADGRGIYVSYVDHAVTKVALVRLDGKIEPVAEGLSGSSLDRPYSGGEFSVSANGRVAYTSGTPERPSDIWVVIGGRARQLTHLNADLFRARTLAQVRTLPVKSSFDQRPIDAWVVMPPNAQAGKQYPLILEIHGGPFASYGPAFSTDDQLYAAAGYAVLYTNPRGSTSYGDEFANQINHDYPSHDYDDLMSAVDTMLRSGSADPDQLFVTGGSGGGVLTAWIIGRTQRFHAAAVQKPVINWASWALTTDDYPTSVKYWFAKPPWEDPESYWKHSPLSLVGNVSTPTLIVVGDQDLRTPPSDAEQYYQALQLRGIPTALIKVPGASHGGIAARPSQSAAKASAIIAWFNRYRGDGTAEPGEAAARTPF
jgi:dipeptidyl aminopeptidase/acylaminoacyl peptidase